MILRCCFSPAIRILVITLATALNPIYGATSGLNSTADAFVTTGPANNLATNNYGAGGSVGLAAAGLPKGEFQTVLRFDTSAAKSSFDSLYGAGAWSLQSVTLQLTATTVNNTNFNANAAGSFGLSWMQNDSWIEGSGTPNAPGTTGITYNTLQSTFINAGLDQALGTFSYGGSSSGSSVYTLNLSSGLVSDILAGDQVSIRSFGADNSISYLFNSHEFGTPGSRPLLSITAVPEPATTTLLALGLVGFLCATRRTRES
jgi:hypothetical protein